MRRVVLRNGDARLPSTGSGKERSFPNAADAATGAGAAAQDFAVRSLESALRQAGGVASVTSLLRLGVSRGAVERGSIHRIRTGWVCLLDADPLVVRAVELGGRVGCESAARLLGWWSAGEETRLHVSLPRHSGRAIGRTSDEVVVHWEAEPFYRWRAPIERPVEVARQLLQCAEYEDAVASIDSALNRRQLSLTEFSGIVDATSSLGSRALSDIDGGSESGLETLARLRLRALNLRVRTQVAIAGVGRVDLVVGDRIVVETDGAMWHADAETFARDRARDLALMHRGYHVIRLTYAQVMFEWAAVELAIVAMVGRGEHLWTRGHRRAGLAH
jgi:very-short-patch-repair endonuclease